MLCKPYIYHHITVASCESNLGIGCVSSGAKLRSPLTLQVLTGSQSVNPIHKQSLGICRNISAVYGNRHEHPDPSVHGGGSNPPTSQLGGGDQLKERTSCISLKVKN